MYAHIFSFFTMKANINRLISSTLKAEWLTCNLCGVKAENMPSYMAGVHLKTAREMEKCQKNY